MMLSCRHANYADGHCAEMTCPRYVNRCARHASGNGRRDAACSLNAPRYSQPRTWQDDVRDFHTAFGVTVGTTPGIRGESLRGRLIAEEITELADAIDAGDLPGAVDGIVDAIYVLVGTAVTFGVDLAPIWDAVHTANMAKIGGAIRDDGKVLKPDGWTAPDVALLLRAQGWTP